MLPLSAFPARRAAAGACVLSAAALLAACSAGTPAPSGTTAPPPSASQPGTAPAGTPAPGGTPAAQPGTQPAGPAACATSALHVSVAVQQGAAGTVYYNITFTNTSGATCVLRGYPGVSLVSAGSDAGSQIGSDAKRDPVTPVTSVTVPPGHAAIAVLGVTQAANYPAASCQQVTAHWLKVFPPNQTAAAYVPFTVQTCASTKVPTMHIAAVSTGSGAGPASP